MPEMLPLLPEEGVHAPLTPTYQQDRITVRELPRTLDGLMAHVAAGSTKEQISTLEPRKIGSQTPHLTADGT